MLTLSFFLIFNERQSTSRNREEFDLLRVSEGGIGPFFLD